MNVAAAPAGGPLVPVIVCLHDGRSVGLVVDQILDIVEMPLRLQPARMAGVLGTTVIQQRVTDVLDLNGVLERAGAEMGVRL